MRRAYRVRDAGMQPAEATLGMPGREGPSKAAGGEREAAVYQRRDDPARMFVPMKQARASTRARQFEDAEA